MSIKFTQNEVESELRDCFPNGLLRAVSIQSGIGETYLGRGLNPNDEHESFTYQFLRVQCALDAKNPEMGEKHWQAVERFRELSRQDSTDALCVHTETARAIKEDADVAIAHAMDKPLETQLIELDEPIHQKEIQRKAIIHAIQSRGNYGGPVDTSVRTTVKAKLRKVG